MTSTRTAGPATRALDAMAVSPTLAVNEEIARRRAARLSTVPSRLRGGQPPVHPELVDELLRQAHRGDYGPVAGVWELREAAAGHWSGGASRRHRTRWWQGRAASRCSR
jgi:hypothetical protein